MHIFMRSPDTAGIPNAILYRHVKIEKPLVVYMFFL